ncbi:DUF192 domain-containing protein [Comamonas serinivorans]|uniref:DUF192 domain-containing protein n=1 Tax=Comamonas serinivorans TaxID=1082851 RepID=UPI003AAAB8A1
MTQTVTAPDSHHALTQGAFQPARNRRALASLCLGLACLWPLGAQAQGALPPPQMDLPRAHLSSGMYRIEVQIAATDRQRQVGLMNRASMPDNEGMLFVFDQPSVQCFWMRNTLLPLTAAFIDDAGTVVNLKDMKPQTDDNHCSAKPVRYVLEMNQGWFDKRHVKPGSTIKGLPGR